MTKEMSFIHCINVGNRTRTLDDKAESYTTRRPQTHSKIESHCSFRQVTWCQKDLVESLALSCWCQNRTCGFTGDIEIKELFDPRSADIKCTPLCFIMMICRCSLFSWRCCKCDVVAWEGGGSHIPYSGKQFRNISAPSFLKQVKCRCLWNQRAYRLYKPTEVYVRLCLRTFNPAVIWINNFHKLLEVYNRDHSMIPSTL